VADVKSAFVLVVILLGCGARQNTPPSSSSTPSSPSDNSDPMREYGRVFHSWEELPREVRSQVPSSAFNDHIVVRIDVQLGCIERDPAKRPRKGYAWPEMAQRCIEGINKSHPVVTMTESRRMAIATWARPDPDELLVRPPQIGVHIDKDEIGIGLAPLIGPCDGIWLVDTHWLLLPKRPVSLGLIEGGGVCYLGADEE
jgi:hypothetical protein